LADLFVNWPLLLGTTAAAIPVILHLIYRRRAPRVLFATLRFIRASAERTARRRRIQEWLLLLLRTAAIFLLAVGLAGPIIRSARLGSGGDAAVAIVVDNSYSMAAEFEGRSRYGRATEFARGILSGLSEGSLAARLNAWPAGDGTGEEVFSADRSRLAEAITTSDVSLIQGDLAAAVTRAEELLRSAPTDQREIFLLTDLQKATWRPLPRAVGDKNPVLILVDCGPGDQANVAVTELDVLATRPAAGVPLTIRAKVRNLSGQSIEAAVSLYVDRVKRAERSVAIAPDSAAEVGFQHAFVSSGIHTGWVDVEVDDALPLDNRRYFALEVPERSRVAVVRERGGTLPQLDEGFFLIPALNPAGRAEGLGSPIEPVAMLRSELKEVSLSDFAAVFLLNVPALSAEEMRVLESYVSSGGGLVIFPGDETRADAWNAASAPAAEKGLLPAKLAALLGGEATDAPITLAEVDEEHPVFAPFAGMPATFFNRVQVTRYFDLQVEHGSRGRVLAQLSDGKPFLVEKEIGEGRVLLFCTAANASWSNFPLRTLYLPLLHQIAYCLARGRGAAANYLAGEMVRIPTFAGGTAGIDVTGPDGRTWRVGANEEDANAVFKNASQQGIYRWQESGAPVGEGRRGAFAVNPDAGESDLTTLTREEVVKNMLGGREAHFARNAEEARRISRRLRTSASLSGPLLLVVIALVVVECFLANRSPSVQSSAPRPPLRSEN